MIASKHLEKKPERFCRQFSWTLDIKELWATFWLSLFLCRWSCVNWNEYGYCKHWYNIRNKYGIVVFAVLFFLPVDKLISCAYSCWQYNFGLVSLWSQYGLGDGIFFFTTHSVYNILISIEMQLWIPPLTDTNRNLLLSINLNEKHVDLYLFSSWNV